MVQILFTVFGMGHIYENAQIIHNHGTLLHTTVVLLTRICASLDCACNLKPLTVACCNIATVNIKSSTSLQVPVLSRGTQD